MAGMNGIQIRRIDASCDDVYQFREEIICVDEASDERFLTDVIPYSINIPEEVWKFSRKKWESIGFDGLFGVYFNGDLAAISGSKLYGTNSEYLRLGMMYYVLKRFRKLIRSSLWAPGGMIESAIEHHSHSSNIEISFVSIYPHNTKLAALCDAMTRRVGYGQIGNGTSHIDMMRSFNMFEHKIHFNGVPQHILYRAETETTPDVQMMINILDEKY